MTDTPSLEIPLKAYFDDDPEACVLACRELLAWQGDHPLGGHLLAWALAEQGFSNCDLLTALAASPETAKAKGIPTRATLGWMLWNAGRTSEAIKALTENLSREPGRFDLQAVLGIALLADDQPAPAARLLAALVSNAPKNPVTRFHLSHALLHVGEWERGWEEFEKSRFSLPSRQFGQYDHLTEKFWTSQDIAGKRIVIAGEQGFGDQIQFIRFAGLLKSRFRAAEVHFSCHPALSELMQTAQGLNSCAGKIYSGFDYFVPVMSLPHRCGLRPRDEIYTEPYLRSTSEAREKWAAALPRHTGQPRIGIAWRSAPMIAEKSEDVNFVKKQKSLKTLDLEKLVFLLKDRADVITLQFDPTSEETTFLSEQGVFQPRIGNFTDSAALIDLCDHIITIDTAVAHLAGALGARTQLLLSRGADWRWTHLKNGSSTWYPATTPHRQTREQSWEEPLVSAVKAVTVTF